MKALVLMSLFVAACGDTGQQPVTVALSGAGADPAPFLVGDWEVTLDRAEVGFGPAYWCATSAADAELCTTAIVELRGTVAIDALEPAPQDLGELAGVTGLIRSATFDYGISWPLPSRDFRVNDGAPDGHTLVLDGVATRGADTVEFHADIDVPPNLPGNLVMVGQHTTQDVQDSSLRLTVGADARGWLADVDFDELLALGDDVVIEDGSRDYSSIVTGLTSVAPVSFTWTDNNQE